MAGEDARILDQVKKDVTDLRKLGEEWGMTSDEIHSCINEAFSQRLQIEITEKIAKKIQTSTKWSKVRFAFRVWLAFVIALCGFTLMLNETDYMSNAVSKVLQPYGYQMMRAVRLVAVPFHHFNISSYHNSECLVTNPYFLEADEECGCEGVNKVRMTRMKKEKELGPQFFNKPIAFKGLNNETIRLSDVVDLLEKESIILNNPALVVTSSVDWVKIISDLKTPDLQNRILAEKDFHIEWHSRRIQTSQALRKLFPRPYVLPKKSEVVIDKALFIGGPESSKVLLNSVNKANDLFYIQGSGSRLLEFQPPDTCEDICDSFQVQMSAGDVLAFPNYWKVSMLANEGEISISFLGGTA